MSDLSPRFRPVLDTFPGYRPGKVPTATAGQAHKLSSNESPYGPLPSVTEVIIAADADQVGIKAAHAAARRWYGEGRKVRIAKPPEGNDFNDLVRSGQ